MNVVKIMFDILSNPFILIVLIGLTIAYYCESTYYQCGKITSHFSLTYFFPNQRISYNTNFIIQIGIITVYFIYFNYIMFCLNIKLNKQIKLKKQQLTIDSESFAFNSRIRSKSAGGAGGAGGDGAGGAIVTPFEESLESWQSNDNVDQSKAMSLLGNDEWGKYLVKKTTTKTATLTVVTESENGNHNRNICIKMIYFFIFLAIYVFGIIASIFYIVIKSLPNDNLLDVRKVNLNSSFLAYFIDYSVAFLLTMINIYIVPKLTDTMILLFSNCKCQSNKIQKLTIHYRSYLIFILRSLLIIYIPFIASIALLPKCGNFWTVFWKPCIDKDDTTLNISFHPNLIGYHHSNKITLSSKDDICQVASDLSFLIKNNHCIRDFLDEWSLIIETKLVIFLINPMLLYFVKKYHVKRLLRKLICRYGCFADKQAHKRNHIYIEYEYAAIATKLEICVIFSPIMPYIVPITCLALQSNKIVYNWILNDDKLNWIIVTKSNSSNKRHLYFNYQMTKNNVNIFTLQFPTILLFLSAMLSQGLLIIFSLNRFDKALVPWYIAMSIIFNVMQSVYYVKVFKKQ